MAFSVLGLALGLAVLAPSLSLLAFKPADGLPDVRVPLIFVVLERAGQLSCLALAMFTPLEVDGWLAAAGACLLAYYALWGRYFAGRTAALLYAPLGPLPIPMAVFPVLTFMFAAVSGRSPWLAAAAGALAAGHWSVSALTAEVTSAKRSTPTARR